jgi:hypothetical protein
MAKDWHFAQRTEEEKIEDGRMISKGDTFRHLVGLFRLIVLSGHRRFSRVRFGGRVRRRRGGWRFERTGDFTTD